MHAAAPWACLCALLLMAVAALPNQLVAAQGTDLDWRLHSNCVPDSAAAACRSSPCAAHRFVRHITGTVTLGQASMGAVCGREMGPGAWRCRGAPRGRRCELAARWQRPQSFTFPSPRPICEAVPRPADHHRSAEVLRRREAPAAFWPFTTCEIGRDARCP